MKTAHGLVGGASEGVAVKHGHLGNPPFRFGDVGRRVGLGDDIVKQQAEVGAIITMGAQPRPALGERFRSYPEVGSG